MKTGREHLEALLSNLERTEGLQEKIRIMIHHMEKHSTTGKKMSTQTLRQQLRTLEQQSEETRKRIRLLYPDHHTSTSLGI